MLKEGLGYQCSVDSSPIQVRRLVPAEADLYREIRLEALRRNPEAFGSTFEVESARPISSFSERLSGSAVFGVFDDASLVGIAGLKIAEGPKDAHKGMLWGMFVRANARNAGVGARLLEAIIDFARQRIE